MNEDLTIYEKAITTSRSAETLARVHGFSSVAAFAESIPQGARILDVGAGTSSLGTVITSLRSDVLWTNFDYSYHDPKILESAKAGAPTNLKIVAGDATRLTDYFEPDTFDGVFSYWLLPHLSLERAGPAWDAATGIYTVAKPEAYISVGPVIGKGRVITLKAREALHMQKHEKLTKENFAAQVVHETQLRGQARKAQKLANEVLTPFFGTSRYAIKSKGKVPRVLHPQSGEYVSLASRKGAKTVGSATLRLAKAAAKQRKVR